MSDKHQQPLPSIHKISEDERRQWMEHYVAKVEDTETDPAGGGVSPDMEGE